MRCGRYAEAEDDYRDALRILRAQLGDTHYKLAYPLHGLGEGTAGKGRSGRRGARPQRRSEA